MSFQFGDGFDLYRQLTECGTHWDASFGATVSLGISQAGRFTGSRGIMNITGGSAASYITKASGTNEAAHHVSLAFQQITAFSGTANHLFITLYDGTTAQCTLAFRSDGALLLTAGLSTGTTLATYTGAVSAINTWYHFEIEVVINNTTGSIAVRRNGSPSNDFSLGSLNTRVSANNYANKVGLGAANFTSSQVVDDFLWRSDASSVAWLGDIRCYTRRPLADSAVQFTRSGSIVPVTPYVQGSTVSLLSNTGRYNAFIATCDGTIATASVSLNAALTGNMKCTLFSNSGSNTPGTVLASATPLNNPGIGSNTFTFASPPSVTRGTTYWIGFNTDASATNAWNTTSGSISGQLAFLSYSLSVTYASFPTANPAVSGLVANNIFTINITPTTLSNAVMVSEALVDTAGYVLSSTASEADFYTLDAIDSTPTSILAVVTRGYFQKSDAGARSATVQLKSGGTTVQGTSTALPAGSWQWISRADLTDPATGSAWTATGVNNATVGAVVTL